MKTRTTLLIMLLGCFALLGVNSVLVSGDSDNSVSEEVIELSEEELDTEVTGEEVEPASRPFVSSVVLNTTLNSTSGNQSEYFSTTSATPHYKVWIHNMSNYAYQITVTSDSPTGTVQKTHRISANTQDSFSMTTNSPGVRYVNVTSSGGYPLKGSVSVRIASSAAELR